jgi:DNA-binding response OmpR family regulator
MPKGRVLVIDDDEWVCRLLSVAMKEAGFEITISENAADGFYRAVEDQPDCVVCDVDLPDQNGYWVARKIRAHPSRVSMAPFVFLSGLDDREHRLEGFQVGGDAYLTKPFRIDEVVAQVDALIQMAARLRRSRANLASIPPSGPAMVGNLAQMSVATVLTLLDLERRSGKLEVTSAEKSARFLVVAGAIAESRIDEADVAPIAAIRTVMTWDEGKFAFTPTEFPAFAGMEGELEAINGLLMEAARLEDEARQDHPSDRPSRAFAWRETLARSTSVPPRDLLPPSAPRSSDATPHAPRSEPRPAPEPVRAVPPPARDADAPPSSEKIKTPSFGPPPIPPPPPSSLKPLVPPAELLKGGPVRNAPAPARRATPPQGTPPLRIPNTPSAPPGPKPAAAQPKPARPPGPPPKTGFGGPMRSLSPSKFKAVVPQPPPSSRPPPAASGPPSSPPEGIDSGWSVPPPPEPAGAPESEAPANAATPGADGAKTGANRPPLAAPTPPRPQRAGQGGGERG